MNNLTVEYLEKLELKLAQGAALLPDDFHEERRRYLEALMLDDGGFAGPRGGSDGYYTAFGLRTAHLLGLEKVTFWNRAADWLQGVEMPPRDLVDCFSLLVADRLITFHAKENLDRNFSSSLHSAAKAFLDEVNLDDSAPAEFGAPPGLYSPFLVILSLGMLGADLDPESETELRKLTLSKMWIDLRTKKRPENWPPNITQAAAAVSILAATAGIPPAPADILLGFIVSLQRNDGGFAAHLDAPVSDALSTFTALVAITDIAYQFPDGRRFKETVGRVRLGDVARFIKSLATEDGGFRGVVSGAVSDVEYTYYGIATLGLLAGIRKAVELR